MKTNQQITQELAQEQAIFSQMVPGSIWRSPSPSPFYSDAPFFYLILSDGLSSIGQKYKITLRYFFIMQEVGIDKDILMLPFHDRIYTSATEAEYTAMLPLFLQYAEAQANAAEEIFREKQEVFSLVASFMREPA
jgi:hypothetical protein